MAGVEIITKTVREIRSQEMVDGLQFRLVGVSGKNVRYRVHCIGKGWLDWVTNYGTGANGYAGWYGYSIDAVQIEVV